MTISEQVKSLGLPAGSYAVFGSGPLAARKLREARDIDIIVTEELFKKLSGEGSWEPFDTMDRRTGLKKDDVSIFYTWAPDSWDIDELIADAEMIDGIPYVALKTVRDWKVIRDQPKDREDIALIDRYLAEHN